MNIKDAKELGEYLRETLPMTTAGMAATFIEKVTALPDRAGEIERIRRQIRDHAATNKFLDLPQLLNAVIPKKSDSVAEYLEGRRRNAADRSEAEKRRQHNLALVGELSDQDLESAWSEFIQERRQQAGDAYASRLTMCPNRRAHGGFAAWLSLRQEVVHA
jgi:hypothetical protein